MSKYILMFLLCVQMINAEDLGVEEKLGSYVPLDLTFINEQSKSVTLRKLMDGKPTLLTLNYFKCAGICTPQLNDMAAMLSRLHIAENTDYKVVTVDFAEDEAVALAKAKKKNILKSMTRNFVSDAWHFVIGENNSSGKLADAVGFEYKKVVQKNGDVGYIHGATLVVLSPTGKITRYLSGIEQLSADVKLAILEASKEEVTPTIAKNSPYCFTKTPDGDLLVGKIEKAWAIFMLSVILGFFIYLVKTSKRKSNNSSEIKEEIE